MRTGRKQMSYLHECQDGGPRKLRAGHHHISPWELDEAVNPGNDFKTHEGQGGWEQSDWIYKREIIFDPPDSLLK